MLVLFEIVLQKIMHTIGYTIDGNSSFFSLIYWTRFNKF